jgi:hypothetical protein
MRGMLRDLLDDMLMFMYEIVVALIKVVFIYFILVNIGHLTYEIALSTAVLIACADFLGGQRMSFKSVQDVRERITTSTKGKRVTKVIQYKNTRTHGRDNTTNNTTKDDK